MLSLYFFIDRLCRLISIFRPDRDAKLIVSFFKKKKNYKKFKKKKKKEHLPAIPISPQKYYTFSFSLSFSGLFFSFFFFLLHMRTCQK